MDMSTEFAIQIATYIGTFGVVYGGLSARLKELEKKMDRHNSIIERTFKLEGRVDSVCERVKRLEEEEQHGY